MGFMKKNGFFIAVCFLVFAMTLSGCAELKDKFQDTETYPENRLYYLSLIPALFETAVQSLKQSGLVAAPHSTHWTRVVIEKPFGKDFESITFI